MDFGAKIWIDYSMWDPSYSDKTTYGYCIDVGNGHSTLIPSALLLWSIVWPLFSPKAIGMMGLLNFCQTWYGPVPPSALPLCVLFFRRIGIVLRLLPPKVVGTMGPSTFFQTWYVWRPPPPIHRLCLCSLPHFWPLPFPTSSPRQQCRSLHCPL